MQLVIVVVEISVVFIGAPTLVCVLVMLKCLIIMLRLLGWFSDSN